MSGMGGTIMPRGTFIIRHQCPGGQSCLGMNVRGDTFSRGTAMPPTPVHCCQKFGDLFTCPRVIFRLRGLFCSLVGVVCNT